MASPAMMEHWQPHAPATARADACHTGPARVPGSTPGCLGAAPENNFAKEQNPSALKTCCHDLERDASAELYFLTKQGPKPCGRFRALPEAFRAAAFEMPCGGVYNFLSTPSAKALTASGSLSASPSILRPSQIISAPRPLAFSSMTGTAPQ